MAFGERDYVILSQFPHLPLNPNYLLRRLLFEERMGYYYSYYGSFVGSLILIIALYLLFTGEWTAARSERAMVIATRI